MSREESERAARRWAESGLLWLTGPERAPVLPDSALPLVADRALEELASLSHEGAFAELRGAELLAERAACHGFTRRGRIAPGGAGRLLEARDGWIAANLPRGDDTRAIAAWLEDDALANLAAPLGDAEWSEIAERVAQRERDACVERGRLLGLAVAPADSPAHDAPLRAVEVTTRGENAAPRVDRAPLVVELASLWAGPLAGRLLGLAGARVVKVESTQRPDGSRAGNARFFDLLNARKDCVALDFRDAGDQRRLAALLERADVVIEGSRPRALAQIGIDAAQWVRARPGRTWLSITGYGRSAPQAEWIAFGDDAAAAAGLCWCVPAGAPLFVGDAIADPLTGLVGARAALAAWRSGEGGLLDAPLSRTTAWALAQLPRIDTSPALRSSAEQSALPPRVLAPERGSAAALGAHTTEVLRELAIP